MCNPLVTIFEKATVNAGIRNPGSCWAIQIAQLPITLVHSILQQCFHLTSISSQQLALSHNIHRESGGLSAAVAGYSMSEYSRSINSFTRVVQTHSIDITVTVLCRVHPILSSSPYTSYTKHAFIQESLLFFVSLSCS